MVDFKNCPVKSLCRYGYSHRSRLERSVCDLIWLREKSGELIHCQHEDHIIICGPPNHSCPKKREYVADFKVMDSKTGSPFWIEAKGFANDRWPTTKTLWRHYGPGQLEIWGGSWKNPILLETIPAGVLLGLDH